jgi:hypothetical protein
VDVGQLADGNQRHGSRHQVSGRHPAQHYRIRLEMIADGGQSEVDGGKHEGGQKGAQGGHEQSRPALGIVLRFRMYAG